MAETALKKYERWLQICDQWSGLLLVCEDNPCVKSDVVSKYTEIKKSQNLNAHAQSAFDNFNPNTKENMRTAANIVWQEDKPAALNILKRCSESTTAATAAATNSLNPTKETVETPAPPKGPTPFDRRLDRVERQIDGTNTPRTPMSYAHMTVATSGYLIGEKSIQDLPETTPDKRKMLEFRKQQYEQMLTDNTYQAVPAIQNPYALIKLYQSDSGKLLLNQKGERRWYEVDSAFNQPYNYASVPTTSSLISWGSGDPNGRTPYLFTDFIFCKYWNKIANNRMITLRRYPAPILDNLKFPGMAGQENGKEVAFPPMSTAVTYFGGDSGNTLNSILKFSTGVLWDDVQADVWEVTTDSTPDAASGPGQLYGGLAKMAEMLNVAGGNFNRELVMNRGQLPPDPYKEGPYENRILGPVNRIDSVKKRKPGLAFQWDGLNLVFEYVGRPVGGINPKAALLDILSNFLVMGSASAVFFGGAHRFMTDPAKYPFLGGTKGIERWYRGDPIGWSLEAIQDFSGKSSTGNAAGTNILDTAKNFIDNLLSGEKGSIWGAVNGLMSGAGGNIINNEIAKKTAGQVPYLKGLKAILTGEPVGEWHVTIGNPLNPIAMIGNLICEGIDVEVNDELGPDDFPTEIKITVKLKHAMARDRDAIESVFNRGMGRIYQLPDNFLGSADKQTSVDQGSASDKTGKGNDAQFNVKQDPATQAGRKPLSEKESQGTPLALGGSVSIWSPIEFRTGISENANLTIQTEEIYRSAYRASDWIAQKSLI